LFSSLTAGDSFTEAAQVGASSLIDTGLLPQDVQIGEERKLALYLLKPRSMAHSKQVREFLLTDYGVDLRDVYVGPSGDLLLGSNRLNGAVVA
jgi:circadian clock protein KaiC